MLKVKESSKRPKHYYIKLEEETPYAVTWVTGRDKKAMLFASLEDRYKWTKSIEYSNLKSIGYKLKLEDKYICKTKAGLVYEHDKHNTLVYDVYELDFNRCTLSDNLDAEQVKINTRRAAIDTVRMYETKLNELKQSFENYDEKFYERVTDYRRLCSEVEALIQRTLAKR